MITTCVSLALAAIVSQPQARQELLPEAPADWRFERIDFPLSFAPQIKYKGFEELRFAPGMFKPDSETYFTYIFAMKIEDEVTLDAAALQALLETYFRGLCQAVAKDKKFDIDVAKISAQVKDDAPDKPPARHFRATVASFDPFVTGKPLTLNMEIIVVDLGPADHRIFAAISPKPAESEIWELLRKLKDEFRDRSAKDSK